MVRLAALATFALAGCTTVTGFSEGPTERIYVGFVRVITPAARGALQAIEIEGLGAGWSGGPFLGWQAGSWVIADPGRCQLLIVIRSEAQAEHASQVLSALEGQQPCIVDYTATPRP